MKINKLREKTAQELRELLMDLNRERFNLKMQKVTRQLSRPDRLKLIRQEIARLITIMNEK